MDKYLSYLIVLMLFFLYCHTARPVATWDRSASIVRAGENIGKVSSGGSLVYIMAARLFMYLPIGNLALRLAFLSGLLTTVALLLLFKLAQAELQGKIASFVVIFIIACSDSIWRIGTEANIHSLSLIFILLSILIFRKFLSNPNVIITRRNVGLWAFVAGLACGANLMAIVCLIILGSYLLIRAGWLVRMRQFWCLFLCFFILGLSTLLLAPLRSEIGSVHNETNPIVKWLIVGHPFLEGKGIPEFSVNAIMNQLGKVILQWPEQFGYFLCGLIILGVMLRIAQVEWVKWYLVMMLLNLLLFFVTKTPQEFLLAYIVSGLMVGFLLKFIFFKIAVHSPQRKRWIQGLTLFLIPIIYVTNYADGYRRNNFGPLMYAGKEFLALPPDSLLFAGSEDMISMLGYYQHTKHLRNDIIVINRSAIRQPGYIAGLTKHSDLQIPDSQEFLNVLKGHVGQLTGQFKGDVNQALLYLLIDANKEQFQIFWEPVKDELSFIAGKFAPCGVFYKLAKPEKQDFEKNIEMLKSVKILFMEHNILVQTDRETASKYAGTAVILGDMALILWFPEIALEAYIQAEYFAPQDGSIANSIGNTYKLLNRQEKALEYFQRAWNLDRSIIEACLNLGRLYTERGDVETAVDVYRQGLRVTPENAELWHRLGVGLAELKNLEEAVSCLQKAALYRPDFPPTHKLLSVLLLEIGDLAEATKEHEIYETLLRKNNSD